MVPQQQPPLLAYRKLFIRCCDASTHMQSVRKKRSLPPGGAHSFLREPGGGGRGKKSSQRFVALSYEFFYSVCYFGIADRSFYASLRDVFGGWDCFQGAFGADSLSPYNAERSSPSSLSVRTQRERTVSCCFHGLTD